jgi:hypothetical protein
MLILHARDGNGRVEMKQTTFPSLAWNGKGKVARRFLDVIEPHYPTCRRWRPTDAAGEDAAHPLHAALVQPVGLSGRGQPVRLGVEAPRYADQAGRGRRAGRDRDPAYLAPGGAARVGRADLFPEPLVAGEQASVSEIRNHCGHHDRRGAGLNKIAKQARDRRLHQTAQGKDRHFLEEGDGQARNRAQHLHYAAQCR